MYPHSTAVSFCQSGIVVLVLFSYPLQLHPCRASLDKFLFPAPPTTTINENRLGGGVRSGTTTGGRFPAAQAPYLDDVDGGPEEEEEDTSTLAEAPSPGGGGSKPTHLAAGKTVANSVATNEVEIPLGRFIVESSVILFSTFLIAMFVSSLETVLGFVGATGSTTISFILPSVFCAFFF